MKRARVNNLVNWARTLGGGINIQTTQTGVLSYKS